MMASGLPSSDARPKLVPNWASVGPATLSLPPISLSSVRAMVPLPDRIGPIMSNIFCCSSRPDST
jgi:hypothetical protein